MFPLTGVVKSPSEESQMFKQMENRCLLARAHKLHWGQLGWASHWAPKLSPCLFYRDFWIIPANYQHYWEAAGKNQGWLFWACLPFRAPSRHVGNGSHLAHGGFQHLQEQQGTFSAQPSPEDFFPVVFMQEPLKHGIQAVLKEEARDVKRPVATQQGARLSSQHTAFPRGPSNSPGGWPIQGASAH